MDYDRTLPVDVNRSLLSGGVGLLSDFSTSSLNDTALTTNSGIEQGLVMGFSPEKQTMKELEYQYQELKKENFELKLRLYYLQEQLKRHTGHGGDVSEQELKLSVQLRVQVDKLQEEKKEIQTLLLHAKSGMDSLAQKQTVEIEEIKRAASGEIMKLKAQLLEQRQQAQQVSLIAEQEKNELQGQLVALKATNRELDQALTVRSQEIRSQQAHYLQQLDEKREQVTVLDSKLKERVTHIEQLEGKLARIGSVTDEFNQSRMKVQELESEERTLQEELRQREARVNELEGKRKKDRADHQREINELKQLQRATMERTQHHYQDMLQKQNQKVNEMQSDMERATDDRKDRDTQMAKLKDDMRLKESELQVLRSQLNSYDHKLAVLEAELRQKTSEIERGSETAGRSKKALQDLTDSIENKDREIQRLQNIIHARDRTLSQCQEMMRQVEMQAKLADEHARTIEQQKLKIAQLEVELRAREAQSQQLQQESHLRQFQIEQAAGGKDIEIKQLQTVVEQREQEVKMLQDQIRHAADMASKKAALSEQHFKSNLQTCTDELTSRNNTISLLEQHLSQLESELEQVKGVNTLQAQTIKEMEGDAWRQQQAMKELQDTVVLKTVEVTNSEKQLIGLASEKDIQMSEMSNLLEGMRQQRREMEKHMQENMAQMKEMNKRQESELSARDREIASLMETIREKDDDIENLRCQQGNNQSRYDAVSQRLSLEQQGKAKLTAQVQSLTKQVSKGQKALESLNDHLRDSMQVNEALQKQLRDAEQCVKQMSSNNQSAQRVANLQQQLDQASQHFERQQRRLTAVQQENKTLKSTMNSSVSSEERSRLVDENERLISKLKESRQLNESLRQNLRQLQHQSTVSLNLSQEKEEIKRLDSNLRECKQINDDLQHRIDEVTAAAKAAGIHPGTGSPIRGGRLSCEMESWKSKLAEKEHQVRLLQSRLETEISKVASMSLQSQEVASLHESLAEMQKQNSDLKQKIADLDTELRRSEGGRSSLESLVKSHAKEVVGLKGQLTDNHRQVKRLKAAIDKLKKENELLKDQGDRWDAGSVDGGVLDSEAATVRQRAALLCSQLEESARLNASLCGQLELLERSLVVEEDAFGCGQISIPQSDDSSSISRSSRRASQPAIVITDVDEKASEIVHAKDPALIDYITSPSGLSASVSSEQIKDLQQQMIESQQSNEMLREQLGTMFQDGVTVRSLSKNDQFFRGKDIQDFETSRKATSHTNDWQSEPPQFHKELATSYHQRFDDLYHRLKATNDLKEQTARSVYDQILKTHRVLQEAQTNMQKQTDEDWSHDDK